MEQVVERLYPVLVHPSRIDDAVLRGTVHQMAAETGVEAFIRQQHAIMSRPDSRPGLGAIQCQTIMIVGDEDKITPPELAEEIARNIPLAKLLKVPECGHLSTLERPDAVTQAMMGWPKATVKGWNFGNHNAVNEVTCGRAQGLPADHHIARMADAYKKFKDIPGLARMATIHGVIGKGNSLGIPL